MRVILKKGRARPFFGRHPWLFSGAIQTVQGTPKDGEVVSVFSSDNQFIAKGLFNSKSQIRVRLYSWNEGEELNESFWKSKIQNAIALRENTLGFSPKSACRLINSEADGLSGLTVDRYGDFLSVQLTSLALALQKDLLFKILSETLQPKGILVKADKTLAALEGLEIASGPHWGEEPEGPVVIEENGLQFELNLAVGQKTGYYLDQRDNRLAVQKYAKGLKALDACCYTGGFALNLSKAGALSVKALDTSKPALKAAQRNAELNSLTNIEWLEADAFEYLKGAADRSEKFGIIVLDPPKFVRSFKDKASALQGYAKLNELAIRLLEANGILVTCSCSGLVSKEDFLTVLSSVSERSRRDIQVLEQRGAASDHPVSATCPETEYLKCFICRAV